MPRPTELLRAAERLIDAGQYERAFTNVRQVLAEHPDLPAANALFGTMLARGGELAASVPYLERAVMGQPNAPGPVLMLGRVLLTLDRYREALAMLERAVGGGPRSVEPHLALAACCADMLLYERAESHYRAALKLKPGAPELLSGLGGVLLNSARADEALPVFRDAAARHAGGVALWQSYCAALNYPGGVEPDEVFRAHQTFGRLLHEKSAGSPFADARSREPERRLRVGYVTSDFFDHSVAYFLLPLIEHHDPARVEVVCIHAGTKRDAFTDRFRAAASEWRDAPGLHPANLRDVLREANLDVLVELAGHTTGNVIAAVAWRCAPVQVSFIGYPNTTGVPAIDGRIVDSITDPPGAERYATERLVRVDPCFLCYGPRNDCPAVALPPSARSAETPITFGSFNAKRKITNETVAFWADVLKAVPGSRMIVKAIGMTSESAQATIRGRFERAGIAADRVELMESVVPKSGHFAAYRLVDIALDTSPYNGTTTTCEALWMGVPVVSPPGRMHAGRVGRSVLSAAGLPELAPATFEAAVAAAARLAADRPALAALRASLRERLLASPLCDARAYAARIEGAYRELWRAHCRSGAPAERDKK